MKRILVINEGFLSGWFDDVRGKNERTISQLALPAYFNKYQVDAKNWLELHSTRFSSKKKMVKFIKSKSAISNHLCIIAKSKGCFELLKSLDSLENTFRNYFSVKIFLIDANKGTFKKKVMSYNLVPFLRNCPNVIVHNFYQRNKRVLNPWGAHINGALNTEIHGVNHATIINSQIILDSINRNS